MVYENKPDYDEVVARQKYIDKGGSISCGHDFWDTIKKMEFGDIVLCNRCNRYWAKIRNLPWVVEKHKIAFNSKSMIDAHTNHLDGVWMAPVDVRVTN